MIILLYLLLSFYAANMSFLLSFPSHGPRRLGLGGSVWISQLPSPALTNNLEENNIN